MNVQADSLDGAANRELVARLGAGDEGALRTLHRRYAPLVFTVAARIVDDAAAEEVVQDVFMTLWQKHDAFDPSRGPLKPWLCQVARRQALNAARARKRDAKAGAAKNQGEGDGREEEIPDDALEPDEALWRAHRRSALRAAVDALPQAERRALSLAYFDELTQEQVAATLHVPLGTTKTRIRLAMRRLAPVLAVLAAAGLLYVMWRRRDLETAREDRALTMVTSSDVIAFHLVAAPGAPPETHASYRERPAHGLAVLTASHLPPLGAGEHYAAWLERGGAWIALGELAVRPDGGALLVAESPELGQGAERVEITREAAERGGGAPAGPPVAVWRQAK